MKKQKVLEIGSDGSWKDQMWPQISLKVIEMDILLRNGTGFLQKESNHIQKASEAL